MKAVTDNTVEGFKSYTVRFKIYSYDEQFNLFEEQVAVLNVDVVGRGLNSFPFQLNLSASIHPTTQINSWMCPGVAEAEL